MVFARCARNVRFASRSGGGQSIRPQLCEELENATQRCGPIDRPPPQQLANRTLALSTRAPENWRA
eukprot:8933901-Lingulodinium_polyedra.AAC.1